jgi:hypothetical protein
MDEIAEILDNSDNKPVKTWAELLQEHPQA